MRTVLIATGNAHKVDEIRSILGDDYHYLTSKDLADEPTIIEDGNSFAANATIKVHAVARAYLRAGLKESTQSIEPTSMWVLADDSGLEVDFLNGAPGVHSARYAAPEGSEGNAPDAANNAKLMGALEGVDGAERTGRFRCVIALRRLTDETVDIFDGACEGRIAKHASGGGGFGYDPLFHPEGHSASFGELGESIKSQISHRSRALAKVARYFADVDAAS